MPGWRIQYLPPVKRKSASFQPPGPESGSDGDSSCITFDAPVDRIVQLQQKNWNVCCAFSRWGQCWEQRHFRPKWANKTKEIKQRNKNCGAIIKRKHRAFVCAHCLHDSSSRSFAGCCYSASNRWAGWSTTNRDDHRRCAKSLRLSAPIAVCLQHNVYYT